MSNLLSGNGAPERAPIFLVEKPKKENGRLSTTNVWCRQDPLKPDDVEFVCTLTFNNGWEFSKIGNEYPPSVGLMRDLILFVTKRYPKG